MRRRRLQLGIHQSEAALKLGVSTVTLSRWECDKVYPTWAQQPAVVAYLGYNPFTNPALGRPGGNETKDVAFLSAQRPANIGGMIMRHAVMKRKTRQQIAQELGLSPKTIWNWQSGKRQPSASLQERIESLLEQKQI